MKILFFKSLLAIMNGLEAFNKAGKDWLYHLIVTKIIFGGAVGGLVCVIANNGSPLTVLAGVLLGWTILWAVKVLFFLHDMWNSIKEAATNKVLRAERSYPQEGAVSVAEKQGGEVSVE